MKTILFILLIQLSIHCNANDDIIDITDEQTWDYWALDLAKMGKYHPEMVDIELYGEIQFKYSFLIDIDGIPKNFKFISAEPKAAEVEKDKVRRMVLFRRYLRKEGSTYEGATLVHADVKWWKPMQSTITF